MMALGSRRVCAPRAPARRARRRRGLAAYTAVEVMMSLAVLTVGVTGIIASEKVTLASNQHSKNLAMATHIAQGWLGMLNAEAALWGTDNSLTRTTWLSQDSGGTSAWFRPNYSAALSFGPAFDALGSPIDPLMPDDPDVPGDEGIENPDARFCVDLRLSPLTPGNNTGGGMIRAEVRVMWLREQPILADGEAALVHACSLSPAQADSADAGRRAQFVFMSSAVRQVGL